MTFSICRAACWNLGLGLLLLFAFAQTSTLQTLTSLYSFASGSSSCGPEAGLILDASGNLYGTTAGCISGLGSVFEVTAADGTQKDLYIFNYDKDGYGQKRAWSPRSRLLCPLGPSLVQLSDCPSP